MSKEPNQQHQERTWPAMSPMEEWISLQGDLSDEGPLQRAGDWLVCDTGRYSYLGVLSALYAAPAPVKRAEKIARVFGAIREEKGWRRERRSVLATRLLIAHEEDGFERAMVVLDGVPLRSWVLVQSLSRIPAENVQVKGILDGRILYGTPKMDHPAVLAVRWIMAGQLGAAALICCQTERKDLVVL